jgi:hypothetical protein
MKLMDEPEKEYNVLKVVEQYQNNIRYTKATARATPAATFATFQGSPANSASPSKTSKASSTSLESS